MDTSPPDRAAVAIEQWRRERPDLDLLPMSVLGRFAEVAHLIARDHINPLFARMGLQQGEFDVLATLRRAGAPYALTPTVLYTALMISSGGMTSRLDRLARAGLIERQAHPEDRRAVQVALTPEGLRLIDGMMAPHVENQRTALAALSLAEQQELNRLLTSLVAGLSGGAQPETSPDMPTETPSSAPHHPRTTRPRKGTT
ncbi:winged helix-turn-helix transcriptional regulator [Pigmentiphaga aceris]|uniref:Winged helix-turn-helix transcriptional regulator n=1 Tax=Pigmentiphaga aceris TaxID=1940612 RepID=A0A5C0ARG2_9BURK|nr:MarR family winged helix-turn-helix transcriptional regulator [Pigmentiphaga aceris]QEI04712.1 winged helix-turn-helix transcriptional regulator [Pigmentiphaga aceris]